MFNHIGDYELSKSLRLSGLRLLTCEAQHGVW